MPFLLLLMLLGVVNFHLVLLPRFRSGNVWGRRRSAAVGCGSCSHRSIRLKLLLVRLHICGGWRGTMRAGLILSFRRTSFSGRLRWTSVAMLMVRRRRAKREWRRGHGEVIESSEEAARCKGSNDCLQLSDLLLEGFEFGAADELVTARCQGVRVRP